MFLHIVQPYFVEVTFTFTVYIINIALSPGRYNKRNQHYYIAINILDDSLTILNGSSKIRKFNNCTLCSSCAFET